MFHLFWTRENGKNGNCCGNYESIKTVYYVLSKQLVNPKFEIIAEDGSKFTNLEDFWFFEAFK